MGNIVKFGGVKPNNSIRSGGFNIGVNSTASDLTGFYNGITPINGGYTIYIDKSSGGPSIYAPQNDSDLVTITKQLGGNVTTAEDSLVWINSQSNMTVINNNYPSIVTDGLSINLDAGFVSSYPKNGTVWNDLSGNNISAELVNGPTFDPPNYGSIVFDGVNDLCTLPINTFTNGSPQNGTFIIKLKIPPFNTGGVIFFRDGGSTGNLIYFYRNNGWSTNSYAWVIYSNLGASLLYGTYLPNEWYEIAFTFDSQGNVKSYTNGALSNSTVWDPGSTSWNRSGSILPNLKSSSASGTGNIQRFMYYNRALSASEVLQNYYAGLQRFVPTDGLVLSLDAQNTNLYATSPTTAYDISGNSNNGTLTNGVQYVSDGDGSWKFDGINDYISFSTSAKNLIQGKTNITIGVWFKLNTIAVLRGLFGTLRYNCGLNLGLVSSNGNLTMYNDTTICYGPSLSNYVTPGIWIFAVATYDGATTSLYGFKNGVKSTATGTLKTGPTNVFEYPLEMMRGVSYYSDGNIGKAFIYDRTLSDDEITTIYNATRSKYNV